MEKQQPAHKILKTLIKAGYTYRQLHECYGLSISTLHNMAGNKAYSESAVTRDLLNSKRPTEAPHWSKK